MWLSSLLLPRLQPQLLHLPLLFSISPAAAEFVWLARLVLARPPESPVQAAKASQVANSSGQNLSGFEGKGVVPSPHGTGHAVKDKPWVGGPGLVSAVFTSCFGDQRRDGFKWEAKTCKEEEEGKPNCCLTESMTFFWQSKINIGTTWTRLSRAERGSTVKSRARELGRPHGLYWTASIVRWGEMRAFLCIFRRVSFHASWAVRLDGDCERDVWIQLCN